VMNAGRLEQIGSSDEIYERPASRFVMNFVGSSNFLNVNDVERIGKETQCTLAGNPVIVSTQDIFEKRPNVRHELAIRPERIRVGDDASALSNRLSGVIRETTYEGASVIYEVELGDKQRLLVRQQNAGGQVQLGRTQIGMTVVLGWGTEDAIIFAGAG
jgi:ABC-type Fe3+/spermidine/putrescine transport system ATPase subunit